MGRRERAHEFFRALPNGDSVRVRFDVERGVVVAFTVQYEPRVEGAFRPAVRYDSAHGRPHRDTLDWAGNVVAKEWMDEGLTYDDALTEAIRGIDANRPSSRGGFLGRKP